MADEAVDTAPVSAADDEVAEAVCAPHPEKVPVPARTAARTRAAAEAAFFKLITPFPQAGVHDTGKFSSADFKSREKKLQIQRSALSIPYSGFVVAAAMGL